MAPLQTMVVERAHSTLMVIKNISWPDAYCHPESFGGRIPEKVDEGFGGGAHIVAVRRRPAPPDSLLRSE